ncbi:uncharacterized protein BJ212DRAFT_1349224 [Suillus subaureus]|uniref:Uncharacterized protein n=1 Tax=Suillus subaureus TaxID=48587 RepID=A0A9P7ECW8_9AGAM|nr:uncharacterized protein BJ212DRAFT_1349224 [Suillus subaureus]KAG1818164.1 hypothetical protein BJ212DRAFT_1349224 [Suillus subaureus]
MSSGTESRRREGANARRTPTSTGTGTPPPVDDTPLAAFFAQFASFSFNANQSSGKNFDRLVRVIKCGPQDPERREVREGFKDALNLCRVLRIVPVPDSIEECRLRVWDTHVNLVDLVDSARTGMPVKLFASLGELTAYTLRKPKKFFPKENAYQGGLLKELLREIINPYFGKRRNGSAKRKERRKKQKTARTAAGGD